MTKDSDDSLPDVDTLNEFLLSKAGSGMGAYVAPQVYPHFKTRQQAYRFAAWCELMGETLPAEANDSSFDVIRRAIRGT